MEISVSDVNFEQEVLKSEIPVLVDFYADWCGPCRMVEPVVKEIAQDYVGKLKVCKVNVDNAPNTASSYGIMSIPALMIFKGGQVAEQVVGARPKAELEGLVNSHL